MNEQPGGRKGTGKVTLKQDPAKALEAHTPWRPFVPTPEDVGAIQALYRGDAAAHQQQNALSMIIRMSRNDGALFFPGEDGRRSTDFALGRAYVGEMLTTILKMKLNRGGSEHG